MRHGATLAALLAGSCLVAGPALAAPVFTPPGSRTTVVYDDQGRIMAELRGTEPTTELPLSAISPYLPQAVIAIEDSRFYSHPGIDVIGTARALWTDLLTGRKAEGGSTLTQQLARTMYLDPRKTWKRKLTEAWLAIELERKYSKDQILDMYLNKVYWGHGAYGAQAAAETYFGEPASALTLSQSAMLAGLLTGPEIYTPYRRMDLARYRQHLVLDRMVQLHDISPAEAIAARQAPIVLAGVPGERYDAPYFTSRLIAMLIAKYGATPVLEGGLRVYSTLDLRMQREAERVVRDLIRRKGRRFRFGQAALVAIDPRSGAIKALVGGSDFTRTQFDRAVDAHRQPGSTFKAFVYLTAFANGLTPDATMSDAPQAFPDGNGRFYTPHNFEGEHLGVATLRKALETSNDVIAVKLLDKLGVESVIDTAHALGITAPLAPELALALGVSEVTPLELASAYGVLANDGVRAEPAWYRLVTDDAGHAIDNLAPGPRRVFDERAVRTLNEVLQGVIQRGTARGAAIGRPAAGKTGTTEDSRDAWFVGYTPELVTAIWAGNDDDRPMSRYATGGTVCAPAWARFMRFALANEPVLPFPAPATASATPSVGVATGSPPASGEAQPQAAATVAVSPRP